MTPFLKASLISAFALALTGAGTLPTVEGNHDLAGATAIVPVRTSLTEIPSCASELAKEVIKRRFPGRNPYSQIWDPTILINTSALGAALEQAGVDSKYRGAIRGVFYRLFEHGLEAEPALRGPAEVLQGDALRSGLLLCIVGGECRAKFDGLYVSSQGEYEVASLRYPEFAEEERQEYWVQVQQTYQRYPPVLFASVLSVTKKENDPKKIKANALRWVGMVFHELKHHTNRQQVREWIQANRWLMEHGKTPDLLFKTYVDISGPTVRVDRGFLTIFGESTADNAAFRVIGLVSLPEDGVLLAQGAAVQERHARRKVGQIRRGKYGPSAARALKEGLNLPDHYGRITEQNFLLIGSIINNQMLETIERYREESGIAPEPTLEVETPVYNITEQGDQNEPNHELHEADPVQ